MMRIDSILQELDRRITEHERIMNQARSVSHYDIHMSAARALRGAITLIESYKTDDDNLILGRVDYDEV